MVAADTILVAPHLLIQFVGQTVNGRIHIVDDGLRKHCLWGARRVDLAFGVLSMILHLENDINGDHMIEVA